jgi:alpha-amylase/alpha-mannosidase (GH57 family)
MKNKFVCIHGHFYQPPRENAWLETIESQESAAPFHDWNDKINFECYATNAKARILDAEGKIVDIVNTYSKISFNFGPTLLSWLQEFDNTTYNAILEADKLSLEKYDGHGSAIAQVYSHMIMPLANQKDKATQVIWGIRDFESRFGRKPEGMWLAETAVNDDSLEVLVDNGIKFTILAPRQAKSIRRIGTEKWTEVSTETIDTKTPYAYKLPSGRIIYLYYYNGEIAQAIAFDGILNHGKSFAVKMIKSVNDNDANEIVQVATDGESYGHHHRYGEMALADALVSIENTPGFRLTNYAHYLANVDVEFETQIHQDSSWSCVHGIERWRSNCGCNGGGYNWHQEWRGPLRFALNWLRDILIPIYEEQVSEFVSDPWLARNNYIDIILDRSEANIQLFLKKHAKKELDKVEKVKLLRFLEMQRNAILMFTSCGWFFDEISGIETNQILQYACRAINYANQLTGIQLEDEFEYRLSLAPSNLPEIKNGQGTYEKYVKPSKVNLERVGMHYAASSLFEKYPQRLELFNFVATSEFFERIEAGNQIIAFGKTTVRSRITHSEKHFSFVVLYFGQVNIIGHIALDMDNDIFEEHYQNIKKNFNSSNLAQVIHLMGDFSPRHFTMWELFKEEKQKIIDTIMQKNLLKVENSFRRIYDENYNLMNGILVGNDLIPDAYKNAVQYVLNMELNRFFKKETLEISELQTLLDEFRKWKVSISNETMFKLAASEKISKEIELIDDSEVSLSRLNNICLLIQSMDSLNLKPNVWKSQNIYFKMMKEFDNNERKYVNTEWKKSFHKLGNLLDMKVVEEKVLVN